jgi:hypothetical protein
MKIFKIYMFKIIHPNIYWYPSICNGNSFCEHRFEDFSLRRTVHSQDGSSSSVEVKNGNHVLAEGITLGHCKPVTWAAPVDHLELQTPGHEGSVSCCWVSGTRPNLNALEKARCWRS